MAHTRYKNIQCQKCLRYTVKAPESPPTRDKLWNQSFLFFKKLFFIYIPLDFPVHLQANVNNCVFIILVIRLFLYFWLCWAFVAAHGLSLVVVRGVYSVLVLRGLLLAVTSLVDHGL